MEITISKDKDDFPEEGYELIVYTMEGEADDYHDFSMIYTGDESLPELKEDILSLEVLAKTYPHGRGGDDDYIGPHFEKFADPWNCEEHQGYQDSFENYELWYHDGNGGRFTCEIELDKDDKKFIENEPTAD